MFSVSLMKYNINDNILKEMDNDENLINEYRNYFKRFTPTQLAEVYETLVKLPADQLAGLRLEYDPRNTRLFATLNIITNEYLTTGDTKSRTYVMYKNDNDNPPTYHIG